MQRRIISEVFVIIMYVKHISFVRCNIILLYVLIRDIDLVF